MSEVSSFASRMALTSRRKMLWRRERRWTAIGEVIRVGTARLQNAYRHAAPNACEALRARLVDPDALCPSVRGQRPWLGLGRDKGNGHGTIGGPPSSP